MADINKFSLAQATSNSDGKTSGSGTLGLITGMAGILAFLYGVIDYSFMSKSGTVMSQAIIVITIGAGLLGVRKTHDSKLALEKMKNDDDTEGADPKAQDAGQDGNINENEKTGQ